MREDKLPEIERRHIALPSVYEAHWRRKKKRTQTHTHTKRVYKKTTCFQFSKLVLVLKEGTRGCCRVTEYVEEEEVEVEEVEEEKGRDGRGLL